MDTHTIDRILLENGAFQIDDIDVELKLSAVTNESLENEQEQMSENVTKINTLSNSSVDFSIQTSHNYTNRAENMEFEEFALDESQTTEAQILHTESQMPHKIQEKLHDSAREYHNSTTQFNAALLEKKANQNGHCEEKSQDESKNYSISSKRQQQFLKKMKEEKEEQSKENNDPLIESKKLRKQIDNLNISLKIQEKENYYLHQNLKSLKQELVESNIQKEKVIQKQESNQLEEKNKFIQLAEKFEALRIEMNDMKEMQAVQFKDHSSLVENLTKKLKEKDEFILRIKSSYLHSLSTAKNSQFVSQATFSQQQNQQNNQNHLFSDSCFSDQSKGVSVNQALLPQTIQSHQKAKLSQEFEMLRKDIKFATITNVSPFLRDDTTHSPVFCDDLFTSSQNQHHSINNYSKQQVPSSFPKMNMNNLKKESRNRMQSEDSHNVKERQSSQNEQNHLNQQIDNGIDKRVDNRIDKRVDNKIDKRVDNGIDKHVDNGIDKRVDNEIDKRVDNRIDNRVDNGIDKREENCNFQNQSKYSVLNDLNNEQQRQEWKNVENEGVQESSNQMISSQIQVNFQPQDSYKLRNIYSKRVPQNNLNLTQAGELVQLNQNNHSQCGTQKQNVHETCLKNDNENIISGQNYSPSKKNGQRINQISQQSSSRDGYEHINFTISGSENYPIIQSHRDNLNQNELFDLEQSQDFQLSLEKSIPNSIETNVNVQKQIERVGQAINNSTETNNVKTLIIQNKSDLKSHAQRKSLGNEKQTKDRSSLPAPLPSRIKIIKESQNQQKKILLPPSNTQTIIVGKVVDNNLNSSTKTTNKSNAEMFKNVRKSSANVCSQTNTNNNIDSPKKQPSRSHHVPSCQTLSSTCKNQQKVELGSLYNVTSKPQTKFSHSKQSSTHQQNEKTCLNNQQYPYLNQNERDNFDQENKLLQTTPLLSSCENKHSSHNILSPSKIIPRNMSNDQQQTEFPSTATTQLLRNQQINPSQKSPQISSRQIAPTSSVVNTGTNSSGTPKNHNINVLQSKQQSYHPYQNPQQRVLLNILQNQQQNKPQFAHSTTQAQSYIQYKQNKEKSSSKSDQASNQEILRVIKQSLLDETKSYKQPQQSNEKQNQKDLSQTQPNEKQIQKDLSQTQPVHSSPSQTKENTQEIKNLQQVHQGSSHQKAMQTSLQQYRQQHQPQKFTFQKGKTHQFELGFSRDDRRMNDQLSKTQQLRSEEQAKLNDSMVSFVIPKQHGQENDSIQHDQSIQHEFSSFDSIDIFNEGENILRNQIQEVLDLKPKSQSHAWRNTLLSEVRGQQQNCENSNLFSGRIIEQSVKQQGNSVIQSVRPPKNNNFVTPENNQTNKHSKNQTKINNSTSNSYIKNIKNLQNANLPPSSSIFNNISNRSQYGNNQFNYQSNNNHLIQNLSALYYNKNSANNQEINMNASPNSKTQQISFLHNRNHSLTTNTQNKPSIAYKILRKHLNLLNPDDQSNKTAGQCFIQPEILTQKSSFKEGRNAF